MSVDDLPRFDGMAVRSRSGNDQRFYNPERDLNVIASHVLVAIAADFNSEKWPYIVESLSPSKAEEDDVWSEICDAHDVFANVLRLATAEKESGEVHSFQEILSESGWGSLPERARVGYASVIGHVMFSYFVAALRSESFFGEGENPAVVDAIRTARSGRVALMGITKEDDLKTTLRVLLDRMRQEGIPWADITRIVAREKLIES